MKTIKRQINQWIIGKELAVAIIATVYDAEGMVQDVGEFEGPIGEDVTDAIADWMYVNGYAYSLCKLVAIESVDDSGERYEETLIGEPIMLNVKHLDCQQVWFEIASLPSTSKGWGRYAVWQDEHDGTHLVRSNSGNAWVSSPQTALVVVGSEFIVTLQCMLNVGKGSNRRREIKTVRFLMRVTPNAVTDLENKPGSQGISLRVRGAELVEVLP